MRCEIAVHAQRGRMRSDLSQQPTFDEKPQIVVNRGARNRWNATPDRGVNGFWRMVSVGSDDRLIDHLALVRDGQTVLRGQITELFMSEAHDYRTRIIIKQLGAVSTAIFPATSKRGRTRAPFHLLSRRNFMEPPAQIHDEGEGWPDLNGNGDGELQIGLDGKTLYFDSSRLATVEPNRSRSQFLADV